jgi:hypothetical protein
MATLGEKSFCVLKYHMSKSVVIVQRAFHANNAKDPPTDKTFGAWYNNLLKLGACASRNQMITH